jgi:hypothetical protein
MVCEIEVDSLSQRGEEICEMLRPLTGKSRLAYDPVSRRSEILIAVRSGPKLDLSPTEWRFTTFVRGVRGAYYERWVPVDQKRKKYGLERAYLHLYRRDRDEDSEREFLALHCDPNEPDDTGSQRHAVYKRGPHIHVTAAQQPLPHSHFALNRSHLSDVLASVANLSAAVQSGVVMIRDQVLDILEANG